MISEIDAGALESEMLRLVVDGKAKTGRIGCVKDTHFETKSRTRLCMSTMRALVTWDGIRVRTWTSFSPSATLRTMRRRAALSGRGFWRYSAFRMSSSSLLQAVVVSADAIDAEATVAG